MTGRLFRRDLAGRLGPVGTAFTALLGVDDAAEADPSSNPTPDAASVGE